MCNQVCNPMSLTLNNTSLIYTNNGKANVILFSSNAQFEISKKVVAAQGITTTGLVDAESSKINTATSEIFVLDGDTSGKLTLQAAPATTSHALTLPSANATGYLKNNGSGVLAWAAVEGGGGSGGGFAWSARYDGNPNLLAGATILGDAIFVTTVDDKRVRFSRDAFGYSVLNFNVAGFDFTRDFAMRVCYNLTDTSQSHIVYGFGGSSVFTTNQLTTNGGLAYLYDTVNRRNGFFTNGTQLGSYRNFQSSDSTDVERIQYKGHEGLFILDTIEVRWFGPKRLATVYHGDQLTSHSIDVTSWTPSGTNIFVGSHRSSGTGSGASQCNHVHVFYL